MSQTEELSRREEQFLENVLENLRQRIGKIAQELEEGQKDIESMHEYYWENYTEMDQYGYEDYDNQQALLHRINANQEKLDLKHRFQKMLDSPFFGRVDFIYEGEEEAEPFYIGIGNFAQILKRPSGFLYLFQRKVKKRGVVRFELHKSLRWEDFFITG